MLFLATLLSTTALGATAPAPEPTANVVKNEAFANATDNPTTLQVREWLGIGSGCRAKFDLPGDVTMEFLGADAKNPDLWRVRFHLPKYGLRGSEPVNSERATFARECSLRFSAYFPKDRRIAAVSGSTAFRIDKGSQGALETASLLMVGPEVVAKKQIDYPAGKAVKALQIAHEHSAGKGQTVGLGEQACGVPRILGFDLHFKTDRKSMKDSVEATLAGPKTVEMSLTLEPCQPGTGPTPAK